MIKLELIEYRCTLHQYDIEQYGWSVFWGFLEIVVNSLIDKEKKCKQSL